MEPDVTITQLALKVATFESRILLLESTIVLLKAQLAKLDGGAP
jgi:uncharacterized small protein (DUF1192 family)